MTQQLDGQDQAAEEDHRQRDHAVEPSRLGMRPGVERANDLPAVVRIGAAAFARARVADLGACPVADEPPLSVELVPPQVLALGAEPVVVRLVVREPGRAKAKRTLMGVGRKPLDREGRAGEEGGVARREEHFGAHVSLAAAASCSSKALTPSGCETSVKRMSGPSSVTRLTLYRTPRSAM